MTDRLDGNKVAEARLATVRERIAEGRARGWPPPALVSVHLATTSPFAVYLRNQQRVAEKAGVGFQGEALDAQVDRGGLAAKLEELSARPTVDAVLVEHPLPEPLDFAGAIDRLPVTKDVDGVSSGSLGRLMSGRPVHVPAVALAALGILQYYGIRTRGRRVAVLGRSPTVGLPILLLLARRGEFGDATIVLVHSRTPNLSDALAGAEILISCVGKPNLLDRSVVPKGSVVVDVGLSTVPDPSRPSGMRSVGDADPGELEGWAAALSPVPGGVGPVTVAELMGNVTTAWAMSHEVGVR